MKVSIIIIIIIITTWPHQKTSKIVYTDNKTTFIIASSFEYQKFELYVVFVFQELLIIVDLKLTVLL